MDKIKGTGDSLMNFWAEEDKSYKNAYKNAIANEKYATNASTLGLAGVDTKGSWINLNGAKVYDGNITAQQVKDMEQIRKVEAALPKASDSLWDSGAKVNSHPGLRYNEGKDRYDLLPAHAIEELVKVLTMGARKYADRNWEKGMAWSTIVASLKRHLAKFELGEDYDSESNMLHAAHVMWNAMALTEYYHTYPQGDDRPHKYFSHPKIGLDIDEVIADWVGSWCEKHELTSPNSWNFDYETSKRFKEYPKEVLEEIYSNLKPKIDPNTIPFEPHCYITSRPVNSEITQKWLQKHGFPTAPVYTVGLSQSKLEVMKEAGIQWFIDDRYENFVELNKAGICTFLWDAPWNRRYDVGYKRVTSFKDFKDRFL